MLGNPRTKGLGLGSLWLPLGRGNAIPAFQSAVLPRTPISYTGIFDTGIFDTGIFDHPATGPTIIEADGNAAGSASVSGQALSRFGGVASTSGSATVSGQSLSRFGGVGQAAASAVVSGVSAVFAAVTGASSGVATVNGTSASINAVTGSASGVATVSGNATGFVGTDGNAAGLATVSGTSATFTTTVGTAAGVSGRVNFVRNPRFTGAVAGTPGTNPTLWAPGAVAGITFSIVGTGVDEGIEYLDVRWNGTNGAGALAFPSIANPNGIVANAMSLAAGETFVSSAYVKVVGGSTANLQQIRVTADEWSPVPAFVGSGSFIYFNGSQNLTNWTLGSATRTATAAGFARISVGLVIPIGAVIDITLRIGWPSIERRSNFLGAFPAQATDFAPVNTGYAMTNTGAVGSASGSATPLGVSAVVAAVEGSSAGVATVSGVSATFSAAVGTSAGAATISGATAVLVGAVGNALGVSAASADAAVISGAVGNAIAQALVDGQSSVIFNTVFNANGVATVSGEGEDANGGGVEVKFYTVSGSGTVDLFVSQTSVSIDANTQKRTN